MEQLTKLRPDRDLQCYFYQPSAIAALSETSANGFTISGCWRQAFDWVVLEWNRDNVFEHPALRNLPDGDLSGVKLSYQETRTNCIPPDSTLYPTVDWPYLRVFVEGVNDPYKVPLNPQTTAPATWQVNLDFGNLKDVNGTAVPTTNVRKLRWTWAADRQPAAFQRSEFSVVVSNWNVSGNNLVYSVAGPGSRRIEDDAPEVAYQGTWAGEHGNYSGGSIRWTTSPGSSLRVSYLATAAHSLYLGTRRTSKCGLVTVQVDGNAPVSLNLALAGEDVLVRVALGAPAANVEHTVTITHSDSNGEYFYFDFLEIAVPTSDLPVFAPSPATTLATDWDTNHSLALAPERTAWLIHTLGFQGRANHYAGALWFYELSLEGNQYASATINFSGTPELGKTTQISLDSWAIGHLNVAGDTAASVATCFALLINANSTSLWAEANGPALTITARAVGTAGNGTVVTVATNSTAFTASPSTTVVSGGVDGKWLTDLTASPRINRAARDWSRSFFQALKGYGISVTASFSTELGNGDDSVAAGIAQRMPNGDAQWVNTPALQTNFSPASLAFWQQVYLDMANTMAAAGVQPYLQFGEVQWWYFAGKSGMPFYDAYTTSTFQAQYGRPMGVITSELADPSLFPEECAFLPELIGKFTQAIMAFVRQGQPLAQFEVLYPPDTNASALDQMVNLPRAYWTAANLACFKTENFTYTGDRLLDKIRQSVALPAQLGFPASQSSHLVGIGDYTTPWEREQQIAMAARMESVVLFALDQFCLIGYGAPVGRRRMRRAVMMGR